MSWNRERSDAAGTQHSPGFAQGRHVVVDVLDHLAKYDCVEGPVCERQRSDVRLDDRPANALREDTAGGQRDVRAYDFEAPLLEQPRERSLPRPRVEDRAPRGGRQEELQKELLTQLMPRADEVRCRSPLVLQG
jgi:hypothetical protein